MPDTAAMDKRAARIAFRTFRRRPEVVGHTQAGETIFQLYSTRMILDADEAHVRRLVPCSKCGQDVVGELLQTVADLDRVPQPLVCESCVKAAAPAWRPMEAPAAPPQEDEEPPVVELVAPDPLVALQAQIEALEAALAELATRQKAEAEERRAESHRTRAGLQKAVQERLDALGRRVSASEEAVAAGVAALDDRDIDRTVVPAVPDPHLEDMRSDLQAVAASHRELAEALSELDQRLLDMAERLAARPTTDHMAMTIQGRVEETHAALAQSIEAQGAALRAELVTLVQAQQELDRRIQELSASVVAQHAGEIEQAELRQELAAEIVALRGLVERQGQQIDARPADASDEQIAALAQVVENLAGVGPAFDRRLDLFERRTAEQEARLQALAASSDQGAARLQELDSRLQAAVKRLTRMAGAQGSAVPAPRPVAPPVAGPSPRTVLDDLDRQLLAAELRLSREREGQAGGV